MLWTALQMLMGERTKFLGIIFGVTFAALLMSQQMAIFCGIMRLTTNQIRNVQGIDIWVMDPDVRGIDESKPLAETSLYRVRSVPGVQWAVPFFKGVAPIRLTAGRAEADWRRKHPADPDIRNMILQGVMLVGLDDPLIFSPLGQGDLVVGTLDGLRQPDAVIVDKYSCQLLWPEEGEELKTNADYQRFLGRTCELNDHRVVIAGICRTSPTFATLPIIYTTFTRVRQFLPSLPKSATFILVKAQSGVPHRQICQRIESLTALKALTTEDFTWSTIWYYITRTGIPFNFGITVILGFLVGTAIAGQTFYQFTIENLKQFGALKAMGTSNLSILGMILLQALIVAPIGYSLGVGLAALFGEINKDNPTVAFYMPWQVLVITAAAVFLICILSSLLSARRVLTLEPAIVFRG